MSEALALIFGIELFMIFLYFRKSLRTRLFLIIHIKIIMQAFEFRARLLSCRQVILNHVINLNQSREHFFLDTERKLHILLRMTQI